MCCPSFLVKTQYWQSLIDFSLILVMYIYLLIRFCILPWWPASSLTSLYCWRVSGEPMKICWSHDHYISTRYKYIHRIYKLLLKRNLWLLDHLIDIMCWAGLDSSFRISCYAVAHLLRNSENASFVGPFVFWCWNFLPSQCSFPSQRLS